MGGVGRAGRRPHEAADDRDAEHSRLAGGLPSRLVEPDQVVDGPVHFVRGGGLLERAVVLTEEPPRVVLDVAAHRAAQRPLVGVPAARGVDVGGEIGRGGARLDAGLTHQRARHRRLRGHAVEAHAVPGRVRLQGLGEGGGHGGLGSASGEDRHVLADLELDAGAQQEEFADGHEAEHPPAPEIQRRHPHQPALGVAAADDEQLGAGGGEVRPPQPVPLPAEEERALVAAAEEVLPLRREGLEPGEAP